MQQSVVSARQQSVRHSSRGEGRQLSVHEDSRAVALSLQALGKSQTVAELRKSTATNQPEPYLLAEV